MELQNENSQGNDLQQAAPGGHERAWRSREFVTMVGWLIAGVTALAVGGISFIGTSISLALVIALFLLLSPVLIPLGIAFSVVIAVTLIIVGSVLGAITVTSWLYNYCRGRDPPGANRVDAARERIVCIARDFKEWASNYSSQLRAAPSA